MRGDANFVMMVKPELGRKFSTEFDNIFGESPKTNKPQNQTTSKTPAEVVSSKPEPKADGKSWCEVI